MRKIVASFILGMITGTLLIIGGVMLLNSM